MTEFFQSFPKRNNNKDIRNTWSNSIDSADKQLEQYSISWFFRLMLLQSYNLLALLEGHDIQYSLVPTLRMLWHIARYSNHTIPSVEDPLISCPLSFVWSIKIWSPWVLWPHPILRATHKSCCKLQTQMVEEIITFF